MYAAAVHASGFSLKLDTRRVPRVRNTKLVARPHVTETGRRVRGSDTNGDKVALVCDLHSFRDGTEVCPKSVVSYKWANDGIRVTLREDRCSEADWGH